MELGDVHYAVRIYEVCASGEGCVDMHRVSSYILVHVVRPACVY
jgi:hypothetical protein